MSGLEFLRSTKIISTVGTATDGTSKLKSLIKAGVNVFRLNFSHGNHGDHLKRITNIRSVANEVGCNVAILADLQGPKFRIGEVKSDIKVIKGNNYIFDKNTEIGDFSRVNLSHDEIYESLSIGSNILMDDGKLQFVVKKISKDKINTEVVVGGYIKSNKGINLPDVVINTNPLTPKDIEDLKFILNQDVDWIALSFVQKLSDVEEVKKYIGDKAGVIAKIEKPSALKELTSIIGACEGIMVARGDLGVELPPEKVPGIQKEIILECRQAGKPVIVATQMLESMIDSPSPTRAEASDVATAVFDGADAVMLSAETAVGLFPTEAVTIMDRIICSAEKHIKSHRGDGPQDLKVESFVYNAVSHSAVSLAESVKAKAVVAFTASGNTAYRMARERPDLLLVVMTPDEKVKRRLSLLWGAYSFFSKVQGYEAAIEEARQIIRKQKFANNGDAIVVVAGMPFGISGSTNSIRVVDI
ncbi:MAG: pyruvate kinase [Alphaproteobacteria bacterium]|nr:pyruvate kinase [Alphaproteobacteria bacterium]